MATDNEQGLLAAEESRRQAMVANDVSALESLLADSLFYGHSIGGVDTKDAYLGKLKSGSLEYKAVQLNIVTAQVIGTVGLVRGGMRATVKGKDGNLREVVNTYLGAWEHTAAGWKLLMMQGTATPITAA